MLYKQFGEHSKECYAIKNYKSGLWKTPWSGVQITSIWRDKNCERRGKTTHWVVYSCNCTKCGATIAINNDELMEMISMNQALEPIKIGEK